MVLHMNWQVSLRRILIDGTVMCALLTVVIYGSIYIDPLMWISDYPPDIKAAVGSTGTPAGLTVIAATLSAVILFGMILWSNKRLRRENGGELPFLQAFAHCALLLFFFAVWDLLIFDWLIFVTIQPGFVVIPGTEGLPGYKDYWFHFKECFLGWEAWISILVGGLVLAGLSMIRLGGRRRSEESTAAEDHTRSKT